MVANYLYSNIQFVEIRIEKRIKLYYRHKKDKKAKLFYFLGDQREYTKKQQHFEVFQLNKKAKKNFSYT